MGEVVRAPSRVLLGSDGLLRRATLVLQNGLCVVAPSGGPRDTAIGRRAQREKGATWIGSVAKWHLGPIASDNCFAALQYSWRSKVRHRPESCSPRTRSCARGFSQKSHFTTLPNMLLTRIRRSRFARRSHNFDIFKVEIQTKTAKPGDHF